jgi:hypothetical protein
MQQHHDYGDDLIVHDFLLPVTTDRKSFENEIAFLHYQMMERKTVGSRKLL